MGIVTIECPNCGAPVERKEGEYFGTCPFCGVEVGFDEMKEEVQFVEMQNRINILENQDRVDFINRDVLKKWLKKRNIIFTIMFIMQFIAFSLIGTSDYDSGGMALGVIIMLIVLGIGFFSPITLAGQFPGYIDVYGKPDQSSKAKLKMWLKLFIIAVCLIFAASVSAVLVFEKQWNV